MILSKPFPDLLSERGFDPPFFKGSDLAVTPPAIIKCRKVDRLKRNRTGMNRGRVPRRIDDVHTPVCETNHREGVTTRINRPSIHRFDIKSSAAADFSKNRRDPSGLIRTDTNTRF